MEAQRKGSGNIFGTCNTSYILKAEKMLVKPSSRIMAVEKLKNMG